MYHKYKSLLQNMPTRHLLTKLEKSIPTVRKQIDRLVHVDIVNFFIGASPNEISGVLAEASDPEMKDGPYFSDEYAWYSMSMEPGFPKCTGCKNNVSVIHLTPMFSKENNERRDFLSSKGIFKTQRLMDMFYFDLTIDAIATVAAMMKDGSWKAPPLRVCKEVEQPPDDAYTIPLFDALKKPEIGDKNLLGPFHLEDDKTVGKSHANFQMSIHRLVFKKGQAEPESMKQLGIWRTGFGEKELITESEKEESQWKAHIALTVFRIVTVVVG